MFGVGPKLDESLGRLGRFPKRTFSPNLALSVHIDAHVVAADNQPIGVKLTARVHHHDTVEERGALLRV
ncbi:MAG: hypothetical protein CK538_10790 [Opitutia bacterium]|nr:MAG: hypothetical protein CK538_10790 [Opitutae bacterium]